MPTAFPLALAQALLPYTTPLVLKRQGKKLEPWAAWPTHPAEQPAPQPTKRPILHLPKRPARPSMAVHS